jgi:hypothetical protein
MQPDFSKSGDAMERPNVKAWAWSLCQLQISVPYATLGLPKAFMKRSIQRKSSEIGVPLGVVRPKAIASAPASLRMRSSSDAVRSSASS